MTMADELSQEERDAFIGSPVGVELKAGERLYKLVDIPIDRLRVLSSHWWIRQPAFDELRVRARRLNCPLPELARAQMAVTTEWNRGMCALWVVVLAVDVKGWEGLARSQKVTLANSNLSFIGGGQQLCVPGLDWQKIAIDYNAGWTV
jgi:hypothetical protein